MENHSKQKWLAYLRIGFLVLTMALFVGLFLLCRIFVKNKLKLGLKMRARWIGLGLWIMG